MINPKEQKITAEGLTVFGSPLLRDTQTGRTTRYDYDLTDRLTKVTESATGHTFSQTYSYDSSNRLSSSSEVTQGTTRNITYTYDDDNRISVYKKAALSQNFVYDTLGRTKRKTVMNGDTTLLTTAFAFATVDGNATGLVGGMRNLSGSEKYNQPYYYTYDDNGNLLSIGDGTYTTTYEYDESNQLIRENNQKGGFTYIWGYGDSGNIEFRREYAYTTAPIVVSENGGTLYNYKYTNSGWKDQLTAINSDSYTYDAIGNMLTGGGRTYTWKHGRQLATLTQDGTTWTNTYNADGLRTQRTDGTNTYKYYYSDGKLICMYRNSTRSFFAYTPDGLPYYMTYGGKYYVYTLNLQGDVMAILDDTGKAVVEYTYDAWGNILSITGDLASTVGQFNPLRYRGYVYDNETQLYYLQSRYYDPEIGRFINADALVSTGQGILGNNMYAYCGNNPVCRSDYSGDRYCEATTIAGESTYNRFISCNYQRTASLKKLGQIVDITEKLNGFMEENAQKLRDYADTHNPIDTLIYFITNVTDDGALDIKLQNEWEFKEGKTYIYKGMVLRYDDPGNINFGYVGAELFPKIVLCIGAGLNQLTKPDVPHNVFSYFDDPRDTYMVKYGYGIYKGRY